MPIEEMYKRGGLNPKLRADHLAILHELFARPGIVVYSNLVGGHGQKPIANRDALSELMGKGIVVAHGSRGGITQPHTQMVIPGGWAREVAEFLRREKPLDKSISK
ncbi:hypothetical protein KJ765_06465 [Candidatus Micrarchaeota archaeon]|nr:hypothetical protein [Candidatus Micrarchaeota archaeon]